MHIRPIPLGLTILGIGVMIGSVNETFSWFLRNPVWSIENWKGVLKGLIGWWIFGAVALIAGIIGWLI
jgi:hypothetical protein